MSSIDETMYRLTVQQRDHAWCEIEHLRRRLDAESRAHRDTQERYMQLVKSMADLSVHFANPPMLIVAEGKIDRKSLEAIMAKDKP